MKNFEEAWIETTFQPLLQFTLVLIIVLNELLLVTTVEPVLNGHPQEMAKGPLSTGYLPNTSCKKKSSNTISAEMVFDLKLQGFWQSARVRSRTIDQKSHYFALFAFSRTLPHFSRLFAKKNHKLQN